MLVTQTLWRYSVTRRQPSADKLLKWIANFYNVLMRKQQSIWLKEHSGQSTLPTMANIKPASGVILYINWLAIIASVYLARLSTSVEESPSSATPYILFLIIDINL